MFIHLSIKWIGFVFWGIGGRNGYVDQSPPNEAGQFLPSWSYLEYSEAKSRVAAMIQLIILTGWTSRSKKPGC